MNCKTRILITSGIFPPEIGGPSRMIEQLARDLSRRDWEIMILAFGQPDNPNPARPYQVVKVKSKWSFTWKSFKLGKEADIIYTFDLYTAGFLSWLIGKKLLGKKLVVRFAGDSAWEAAFNQGRVTDDIMTFQTKNYGLKIAWLKKTRSWILRGADKVVAVSQFMKTIAEKIGAPTGKIEVIYNSVDFVDFRNLDAETRPLRRQWGLEGEKVILTGGRLVPWKGIDGLVEAMTRLLKEKGLPPVKLLIVGDGPERQNLELRIKNQELGDRIILAGKVPMDKIFAYYNLADVFVLNSKYEGLSHMLLEVLRLGKPIIASNRGGNPEVIEDGKNGLLVEYNNVEQLKLAIKRMLTEEKWQTDEYKQICWESLKKFSWEKVITQTIKVFEELKNN